MRRRSPTFAPELRAALWAAWRKGHTLKQIASMLEIPMGSAASEIAQRRGFARPIRRRRTGSLTALEREQISRGLAKKWSIRAIARSIERAPSTVSREVGRNRGRSAYRACLADTRAYRRAKRPKLCKLASHPKLRVLVEEKLRLWWSPRQIAEWLRHTFGDELNLTVSHETIYRTLFIQTRGALKEELKAFLRSGRMRRRPRRDVKHSTDSIVDGISISKRPPEVEDRAVPGHWEGDLLMGGVSSCIATLVERHTRFCILVKVSAKDTVSVTGAIRKRIVRLPTQLRRSLTWDRGSEMSAHKQFTVATKIPVFFADPKSPWQRGSNENTNGLLRQWFPKGADLTRYTQAELDKYARLLNGRPRQTLGWKNPAEAFETLLR